MGGVFVGVAALITVIAVMTGLQRDLQSKILGTNPHVFVFEQNRGFRMPDWREPLRQVQAIEGVTAAEPFIMTAVGITMPGGNWAQPGMLYGIDPDTESDALTVIEERIREGELSLGPTTTGYPPVLMGRRLADKLAVFPGDTLILGSMENIKYGPLGEILPSMMKVEVTGTFSTGMYEYDSNNLYAPMAAAQELLDLEGGVSGLAVNVRDPWEARTVATAIDSTLGYPYFTNDWMTLNASLFSALKLEKLAMAVILFLIVLVASFNIISSLIMVVTEKTREIGILKSMGMTDRSVLRIFMLQGLTIGLVGTVLGTGAGLGLVALLHRYQFVELPADVYFIERLPVGLDPLDVLLIMALSVIIAFAATIYPARQASRLEPVEAIRHD